ncbi:MAG: mechanosensitive ion channel family protein [Anaerolineales bacterium]|jgi:small-conductance mechanosensitive channel
MASFSIVLVMILTACAAPESASTTAPLASPYAGVTQSPAPPTPSPEPAENESTGGILLPPPTLAPTLTPDVVLELISEFTEAQGLQDVTLLRLSVENWLNLGYSLLLTIIFGFLLSRLVYFVLKKIVARTPSKYDDLFISKIRTPIFVIIVTFGFQVGTVRLDLLEALVKLRFSLLYSMIYVISGTVIIWRLVDVLVEWYQNEVEPKGEKQQVDTILILLHRGARVLLVSISGIMVLSLLNINVNALIAALGVGGLAISLAAQDTLSNVISGIMIALDQPFRVGDRIEIPKMNTWGDVVDIGLRSTRIRTRDNRLVIVPNNTISTDQVVNYSYPDPRYRIQLEISIGYQENLEKVRQLVVDAVRQIPGVLPDKPIDALIVNLGEYALTLRVRWWIESYIDTRRMCDQVYTAIRASFEKAGVENPTDTYDINIMKMPRTDEGRDRQYP